MKLKYKKPDEQRMRFYFIPTRLEKLRNLTIPKVDKDVE